MITKELSATVLADYFRTLRPETRETLRNRAGDVGEVRAGSVEGSGGLATVSLRTRVLPRTQSSRPSSRDFGGPGRRCALRTSGCVPPGAKAVIDPLRFRSREHSAAGPCDLRRRSWALAPGRGRRLPRDDRVSLRIRHSSRCGTRARSARLVARADPHTPFVAPWCGQCRRTVSYATYSPDQHGEVKMQTNRRHQPYGQYPRETVAVAAGENRGRAV